MSTPEQPRPGPAAQPSQTADLNARVEEVLGSQQVTVERLNELRNMLVNVRPDQLPRRRELLERVQQRLNSLREGVPNGTSMTAEQARMQSELLALQDRLNVLEGPGALERTSTFVGNRLRDVRDGAVQTVRGVPDIGRNYIERIGDDFRRGNNFSGVMSIAVPILSALGIGYLARKAMQKPKGVLGKVLVGLLGTAGLIAIVNYTGRRAQAEIIDRQAREPVDARIQQIIDAINRNEVVTLDDPRLINVDLFQLRGAPISVGGHTVKLERIANGGAPAMRITVGTSTFEFPALAAATVQSVTRQRGMVDVSVLLGITNGHAFVTDAEFSRIAGQLTGQTSNQTVEVTYFTDPANQSETRRQNVALRYVPPVPAGPGPARP